MCKIRNLCILHRFHIITFFETIFFYFRDKRIFSFFCGGGGGGSGVMVEVILEDFISGLV